MKIMKRHSGFTLVEVIVVLVILAVLAAIMIPSYTGWIDKANQGRLISACRNCVNAAQSLATERYGAAGKVDGVPTDAEVRELAEVKKGATSDIVLDLSTAAVNTLTYTDEKGQIVVYLREPSPHYEFTAGFPAWSAGKAYSVGDTMSSGGYIFECTRGHTSGTGSGTSDPSQTSGKSTWKVIGYVDGVKDYSSTMRYGTDVSVTYKGKTYTRTSYDPGGGQVPFTTGDSRYWTMVP